MSVNKEAIREWVAALRSGDDEDGGPAEGKPCVDPDCWACSPAKDEGE